MGLWEWVIDKLLAPSHSRDPGERVPTARTAPHRSSNTVATLPRREATETDNDASTAVCWWAAPEADVIEPAPVPRPDLTAEGRALENLLITQFDGHDLSLPPLPRVPEKVITLLRDPECALSRVAREISEDQVSAAAVLRMANSPLYRGAQPITALETAVVRLGASAIRTLMMHQSMRAIALHDRQCNPELAEMLLLRALASGCVMRSLSRFTRLDAEEAALTGLLHDIGSVIVLRVASKNRLFSARLVDLDTFEYLCYEAHQELGELVADSWNLPERLKLLISDHHRHPAPDDPVRVERLQLQVADQICALLGYGPPAAYNLIQSRAAGDLGLTDRDDFIAFLRKLPTELEQTMEAFI